jgi:putative two-component system response regulator
MATDPIDTSFFDAAALPQMERLIADFGQMYRERNRALQEVSQAHHEALLRLALAAEFRDNDTGIHIVRIGFLAEALALACGASAPWAAMLRKAAPMHDIGKIGIPDAVLKKPGALTPDERRVMNGHASIGADILGRSTIPLFQLSADVALSHHERWDGGGYPRGQAGTDIPLAGRIVAVVDFFDALTMDRCYRPAFSDETAIGMLRADRGRAIDPELVDVFDRTLPHLMQLRDAVNHQELGFSDLIARVGGVDLDLAGAANGPMTWERAPLEALS